MMNGTLEEKKDTPLDEVLEREEWMNKDLDDMTEEERMKLREFEQKEQKLKEEKEKIRKNLELERKKLKADIEDICNRFDDKLFIVFRRRLEFEYRIYEQELTIIRLTLSILLKEENEVKKNNYDQKVRELLMKSIQLNNQIQVLEKFKELLTSVKGEREVKLKESFGRMNERIKVIYTELVEAASKNDDSAAVDLIANRSKYSDLVNKLDPFFELDKLEAKKLHYEDFDNFLDDIHKRFERYKMEAPDYREDEKEIYITNFRNRFRAKKDFENAEKDLQDVSSYLGVVSKELTETNSNIHKNFFKAAKLRDRLAKALSNIELQIRVH
mmetsp:Transcript_8770/g.7740  ORF Transcript_8770/g.7740 Transcript_8770/m.7740 type:complete len:328 (-) Transcript_8770:444-1427(-)